MTRKSTETELVAIPVSALLFPAAAVIDVYVKNGSLLMQDQSHMGAHSHLLTVNSAM